MNPPDHITITISASADANGEPRVVLHAGTTALPVHADVATDLAAALFDAAGAARLAARLTRFLDQTDLLTVDETTALMDAFYAFMDPAEAS